MYVYYRVCAWWQWIPDKVSDTLGLESGMTAMWVLGIDPSCSRRTDSDLEHWPTSQAPSVNFLNDKSIWNLTRWLNNENTCCSCRAPGFLSQHSSGGWQTSVIKFWESNALFRSPWAPSVWYTDMQALTHTHNTLFLKSTEGLKNKLYFFILDQMSICRVASEHSGALACCSHTLLLIKTFCLCSLQIISDHYGPLHCG